MKKRIMMALTCMMLGLGCSSSVMAVTQDEIITEKNSAVTHEIQPRAAECGNCGTYFLIVSNISYGSWVDTDETQKCSKYSTKRDIIQVREVYTTFKCTHCGYTQTVTSSESRVFCNH